MTDNIQHGSPWKHCLEISDLGPGKLDASISLGGAKWIWPTAGISLAIALVLGFASFSAFGAGKTGGGIAAAIFACFALVVAVFAFGCRTYAVRLKVKGDEATFGSTFFGSSKWHKADRLSLGALQCWSHSIGSGRERSHSFHVCLHPSPPIPVLSLFSQEYLPDSRLKAGQVIGKNTAVPSKEEARQLVLTKADELASCLGIEHKTGSNNEIHRTQ